MTKEQFESLCEYLEGPEGCDFRQEVPGDDDSTAWECDGTLRKTVQWMEEHDIEPAVDLARIVLLGGHCDCEVIFNVQGRYMGGYNG